MGVLTILGLFLDLFGVIFLLGPEYRPLEKVLRWFDPIYTWINYGLNKIERQGEETTVSGLTFYALRWFVNRNFDVEMENGVTAIFAGDTMRWDASKIEYRISPQSEGPPNIAFPAPSEQPSDHNLQAIRTGLVRNRYFDLERDWMYKIGLLLILAGFGLQILDQLSGSPVSTGNIGSQPAIKTSLPVR